MEDTWDNSTRFEAINNAIANLPHDQYPMGMGFRLAHNPTNCRRCKASIATLELASIIRYMEEGITVGEEIKTGEVVMIDP